LKARRYTRSATTAAVFVSGVISAWILAGPATSAAPPIGKNGSHHKRTADNSLCYVCHVSLQHEEITKVHLADGYGCVKCHGPSRDHSEDETLMTTPDHLFGRKDIDAMCAECHDRQHQNVKKEVKAFRKKWQGKERPNARARRRWRSVDRGRVRKLPDDDHFPRRLAGACGHLAPRHRRRPGTARGDLSEPSAAGLHIDGGPQFQEAELAVREVQVQELPSRPKEEVAKQ